MSQFSKTLKSDAKKSWPYFVALAFAEFAVSLFEHRILGAINDYIDHNSGSILSAVQPFSIWIVNTPLALLTIAGSLIFIHAFVNSRQESHHTESSRIRPMGEEPPINLLQEANPHIDFKPEIKQEFNPQIHIYPPPEQPKTREAIQETKPPESIPEPPSHNIIFLGGDRYSPDKHGLVGDGIGCENIRFVLAEFRNKHIVGSTVAHVYNVRAGITYRDDNGVEILYISPGEWLRHNADTVKLESGAESDFVILAIYNYHEKHWETHKMVRTRARWGDIFLDEPRPLPFGTIAAEVVLLAKDGTALKGGTVTFELKENGEFEIR